MQAATLWASCRKDLRFSKGRDPAFANHGGQTGVECEWMRWEGGCLPALLRG